MPFISPMSTPSDEICRRLYIPNESYYLAAVNGALLELTQPTNWMQITGIDPIEAAERMREMVNEYFNSTGCCVIGSMVFLSAGYPDEVLPADGSIWNRTEYPRLYEYYQGTGNIIDANTFQTPDLRDRFLMPAGVSYPVGQTGGEAQHQLTVNEMPSHNHTYQRPTFNIDVESVGAPDPTGVGEPALTNFTSNSGGDQPHNNMPPYKSVYIGILAK